MMKTDQEPKFETFKLWWLKMITGPLLIILLGIHLIVNHYMGSMDGLMNYADVKRYFSQPIIPIIEFSLASVVIVHALLGLRSIILDLNWSASKQRKTDLGLLLIGAAMIGYALWLTLKIALV